MFGYYCIFELFFTPSHFEKCMCPGPTLSSGFFWKAGKVDKVHCQIYKDFKSHKKNTKFDDDNNELDTLVEESTVLVTIKQKLVKTISTATSVEGIIPPSLIWLETIPETSNRPLTLEEVNLIIDEQYIESPTLTTNINDAKPEMLKQSKDANPTTSTISLNIESHFDWIINKCSINETTK
uniref:Uncharacterized protein n=1 Tax=Romanomermis culicivorax TaxID=13658 RepID=A0A915KCM1_ROMCU